MTIAVLPPQASPGGGRGLVVNGSRGGIVQATGWTATQPLSGMRCLTREAFEAARPLAHGWGVETALTIDLLTAGYRVVEVPCDLQHRVTGADWRAQVHRAAAVPGRRPRPGRPARAAGRPLARAAPATRARAAPRRRVSSRGSSVGAAGTGRDLRAARGSPVVLLARAAALAGVRRGVPPAGPRPCRPRPGTSLRTRRRCSSRSCSGRPPVSARPPSPWVCARWRPAPGCGRGPSRPPRSSPSACWSPSRRWARPITSRTRPTAGSPPRAATRTLVPPITWRGGTDPVAAPSSRRGRTRRACTAPSATGRDGGGVVRRRPSLRLTVWLWQLLCGSAFLVVALAARPAVRAGPGAAPVPPCCGR